MSTSHVQWVCAATFLLLNLPQILLAKDKQAIGWIETVGITHDNFTIDAKIDSGARHSSLHAEQYRIFKKNNEPWIQFNIRNKAGDSINIEKPIVRTAKIKLKKANKPSQERPVIMLGICVGNVYKEVETNIVNRGHFKYKLLVGRSYLKGSFLVDAAAKYTLPPVCKPE